MIRLYAFLALLTLVSYTPKSTRIIERAINKSLDTLIAQTNKGRSYHTPARDRAYRRFLLEKVSEKIGGSLSNRSDTLIYVEQYDNICANCNRTTSAISIALLIGKQIFAISNSGDWLKDIRGYEIKVEAINSLEYNAFDKLYFMKQGQNPFDRTKFSSCLDGANANVVWFLPTQTTRSIHVDCFW